MKISVRQSAGLFYMGIALAFTVLVAPQAAIAQTEEVGGSQIGPGTCGGHACPSGAGGPYGDPSGQPPSNNVPEPGWCILMAAGGLPMGVRLLRRRWLGS